MGEDERYSGVPENIFDWQRVLYMAAGRGLLTPRQFGLAGLVALSGDGTSGLNCRFNQELEKRLLVEFDVSRPTLQRDWSALRENGWFTQTRKPTYTGKRNGKGTGRQALYRVAFPRLAMRHDSGESRVSLGSVPLRFDSPVETEVVSHPEESRVSYPAKSCLTITSENEALSTSDEPTSDEPTCPASHADASTTGQARPRLGDGHAFAADWADDALCVCGDSRVAHELEAVAPDSADDRDVNFAERGAAAVRAELGKVAGQ